MENAIEEVKKKIDIVDFIGSYVALKKAGRNFKGVCPFHQEKTPSFVVSPDRQIWHCFGACQTGGDAITFLMKLENISFFEALKELAEKTGVKIQTTDFEDRTYQKKERLVGINLIAADFFEYILNKTSYGQKGLDYLKSRDINPKITSLFRIGYAPDSWDSLLKFLEKKKYSKQEIMETGLVVHGQSGGIYDRFRGRLVFPIFDTRGTIVGFSGRQIEGKEEGAKYINTPETFLYRKRETLFGIQLAKDAIKKHGNVYLVEGEFDMITPYSLGIENVVAIKGSAVTKEQLSFLKRYTNKITLTLDTDPAGEEAVKRGINEAEAMDFEIETVGFDFAKDPDEAARKDPIRFKEAMKNPTPLYDFIIALSQRKHPGTDAFSKKEIGAEVAGYLARIQNPIVQSHYVKKLAAILDVTESSIQELIRRSGRKTKPTFVRKTDAKKIENNRDILVQVYLLSLLFQNEKPFELMKEIETTIVPSDFLTPSHQQIYDAFIKTKEKGEMFSVSAFVSTLPNQLRPVFDELYLFASGDQAFGQEDMVKLAHEMKRSSLKHEVTTLLKKDTLTPEEEKKLHELQTQLNNVEKKLISL